MAIFSAGHRWRRAGTSRRWSSPTCWQPISRLSFGAFDRDAALLPAAAAQETIERSGRVRPRESDGIVTQTCEHDVNPTRFHHPLQPMVAILPPAFARSIRARHVAHTRRYRVEFSKGGRNGGSLAQPRMPDRERTARRRSRGRRRQVGRWRGGRWQVVRRWSGRGQGWIDRAAPEGVHDAARKRLGRPRCRGRCGGRRRALSE